MIEDKDFLLREVKRITLLLKELISKVKGLDSGISSNGFLDMDKMLKSNLDISISEIIDMSENDLIDNIININESYLEYLSELIFEIVNQKQSNVFFDKNELIIKNIIIIEILNKKSKTYSLGRMNMKNILKQHLSNNSFFDA